MVGERAGLRGAQQSMVLLQQCRAWGWGQSHEETACQPAAHFFQGTGLSQSGWSLQGPPVPEGYPNPHPYTLG